MAIVPAYRADHQYESLHINHNDAIQVQRNLLKEWWPQSEVWWLKHGDKIIAALCAGTGVFVNTLFRKKLKLMSTGFVSSTLVVSSGPGVLGGFLFSQYITDQILLYQHKCPTCYEIKANIIVGSTALVFPLFAFPLLNLGIAASTGLRVPYLYSIREIGGFMWNTTKPAIPHLFTLLALHSTVTTFVTYKQIMETNHISDALMEMETELENEKNNTVK